MPGSPATTPKLAIPRIANTDDFDIATDLNAVSDRVDALATVADTFANRPAASAALNGLRYWATDKWMEWMVVSGAWVLLRAEAQPWTSSTLPTSPVDGQRITYALTNGGRWILRYNSTATKWDFEGGSDLYAEVDTVQSLAGSANAWQDLTTVGPDITVPFAGDYDVTWGALLQMSVNASTVSMGIAQGAGATPAGHLAQVFQSVSGITSSEAVSAGQSDRFTGLAASTLLRARYQWITANSPANQAGARYMRVRPVRVG